MPYVKYFFNGDFEAAVAQWEAPELVETCDNQTVLQDVDPPSFFVGNVEGEVEEKLWLTLISEEVRKLQRRVRELLDLPSSSAPLCPLQLASPSFSAKTVSTMLEAAVSHVPDVEVFSSAPPQMFKPVHPKSYFCEIS